MTDVIDQEYTYPSASELSLAKNNQIVRPKVFVQTVTADMPYALVALKVSTTGTPAQRRALEVAIEALAGVDVAKILVFGTTPTSTDVPENHRIEAVGEVRFRVEKN